jgi:hypothetical protein
VKPVASAGWPDRASASTGRNTARSTRCARSVTALAAICCAAVLVSPSTAVTHRVDDSASIPFESSATLRWRFAAPVRSGDNTVEGATTVQVRLNLAPWVKRSGRLYLVLPAQSASDVTARWSTQGRLLPGKLATGQRALVYAGPINEPLLVETLVLQIEADGTRMSGTHRLEFHFEIDVD